MSYGSRAHGFGDLSAVPQYPIECFNKAAIEEHPDGDEVFRRMGRRYISEAELYGATLPPKLAERLALPEVAPAHGRSLAASAVARSMMLSPEQRRALAMGRGR